MKSYLCKIAIEPTTLTEDTVYQTFVNTDTKSMRVMRLNIQLTSSDTGNSKSIYAFARIKGTPSGGELLTPTKYNTQDEDSMMTCRRSQGGLTMTGVTVLPYFLEIAALSKTQSAPTTINFDHKEGLILAPGEGLCIFADNAVTSGSGVNGCIEWSEE